MFSVALKAKLLVVCVVMARSFICTASPIHNHINRDNNADVQGDPLPKLHRTGIPTQELKFNSKNLNELAQQ
jgi:hypothetical protein